MHPTQGENYFKHLIIFSINILSFVKDTNFKIEINSTIIFLRTTFCFKLQNRFGKNDCSKL